MDIREAKSILIIPRQTVSQALWLTSAALSRMLQKNKDVRIYMNADILKLNKSYLPPNVRAYDAGVSNKMVITLEGVNQEISDVEWEKKADTLEITIKSADTKQLRPTLKVRDPQPEFELKIFLGISREDAEKNTKFQELKFLSGTSIFLSDDEYITGCFDMISKLNRKIDQVSASELLSALRAWTDNFTLNISPQVFELAAKLMRYNAKYIDSSIEIVEEKDDLTEENISTTEVENVTEKPVEQQAPPVAKVVEPEVLPADFDPLAPAKEAITPLQLEEASVKALDNTPLPSA